LYTSRDNVLCFSPLQGIWRVSKQPRRTGRNGNVRVWANGIFLFVQTLSAPEPHTLSSTILCYTTICCIPNKLKLTSNKPTSVEVLSNDARAPEDSREAPLHWCLPKELLASMISTGFSTLSRLSVNGFPLTGF